jgi:hypothetical protein
VLVAPVRAPGGGEQAAEERQQREPGPGAYQQHGRHPLLRPMSIV